MSLSSPFVVEWVRHHARATPNAAAIGTPVHGWTNYRDLVGLIDAFESKLVRVGAQPGSYVLQSLPASAVAVAFGLAIQSRRSALVEISADLSPESRSEIVRQTQAAVGVVSARDATKWAETLATTSLRHLFVVNPSDPGSKLGERLPPGSWTWIPDHPAATHERLSRAVPTEAADDGETALLVYTSGSTGVPRAVIQTHANVDANTRAIVEYLRLTEADRSLATLPLYYCYGRSVLQTHLFVGGSIFFDDRFMYPRVVMEQIASERCTNFAGVPLTFESLRRQVDLSTIDRSSLRFVTQAGGAMHPDTIAWAREAFAPAVLFVMYGQTEATSRLTYLPPDRASDKINSVGRPLSNISLKIVAEDGSELPPGEPGNVLAHGPSITPGYYEAPSETAAILEDGWLRTGDLGWLDEEGFLFLVGRTKDMLKLAGNRVGAREIEDALVRHPAISSAAVIGITDGSGSEQAVAFVVASSPLDADEVRRHARSQLAAYKVPKFVRFISELPRTASNKVAKPMLQEWIKNDPELLA